MRDAASAAAMSDPEQNRWFRRRWVEPAPTHAPAKPKPRSASQDLGLLGRELLADWRREGADGKSAP